MGAFKCFTIGCGDICIDINNGFIGCGSKNTCDNSSDNNHDYHCCAGYFLTVFLWEISANTSVDICLSVKRIGSRVDRTGILLCSTADYNNCMGTQKVNWHERQTVKEKKYERKRA